MKDTLLTILVIVVALVAIVAVSAASIMLIVSNLHIKPFTKEDILGIDLTGFKNAQSAQSKSFVAKVNTCIANGNPFDIAFSKLFIEIFYNNVLVASSELVDEKTYTIPSLKEDATTKEKVYGKICFPENIQVFINSASTDLFLQKIFTKSPVKVEYRLSFKVFGVWVGKGIIPAVEDSITI